MASEGAEQGGSETAADNTADSAAPRPGIAASPGNGSHAALRRSAGRGKFPAPAIDHFLLSDGWAMMAPTMAAVYLLAGLSSRVRPDANTAILACVAVVLTACAGPLSRIERSDGRGTLMRYLTMGVAVALPMLVFGASVALWERYDARAVAPIGLGAVVIVGVVASIALSGRLASLVVAQAALWAGLAIASASPAANVTLVLGSVFALGAAIRQTGLDRVARDREGEMERTLLRAEEILADYEQTGQGWFWETDRRGALTYVSSTIGGLLARDAKQMIGCPFTDMFILDAKQKEGERTLLFHLNTRSSFQELAVRAATEVEERWWSINGRPIFDSYNNFLGFRGSGSDLTEKRKSEANASRLALFDSLTGLANRFQMSQTLEKILTAQHLENRVCSVFLLDLDRFKQVNDTMGHPAGDALLRQVAQRLQRAVGAEGQVGRLGGDEFKVVVPGHHNERTLGELAERIIESLSQPYSIDGSRVVIGASIGIARAPDDGVTSEAIIRNADLALYAAKDRGRGCHHFYDAELHSDAEERRQLEQDLRDAIAHGGLELYYQPVINTASEVITGFEALLRWNHPRKGRLSPAIFIPVAEDAGLIAPIGEWALRTACHDLARWPKSVRVSVNVSPLQFANPALPAIVTSALASAQVAPDRLELEITESVFLSDDAGTDAMFTALKRVGVRLSLDDFGTGYSSLGYLKKAPFDKIKIDQSFVHGATMPGSRNGAIIASIVSLAEALGMETTAEGVETLDELELVRELGCSHVQGYIYSKAVCIDEAMALLGDDQRLVAQGPQSARAPRRAMLRKVVLQHAGITYDGTIRNVSASGARIEGIWDVPKGIVFQITLADECVVGAVVRWCQNGRMGVEFDHAVVFDDNGRVAIPKLETKNGTLESSIVRRSSQAAA